jgi:hypothetical protein
MRRIGAVLVGLGTAAALTLALGGCAAQNLVQPLDSGSPAIEPVVPATAAAVPEATPGTTGGVTMEQFLRGVTEAWHGAVPSDDELITAGNSVCDQLDAGSSSKDVRVIQGDDADTAWNNGQLVLMATYAFCPEHV